ncbi:MAG TPA: hypothetical protein VN759_09870, partial [Pseudolysinimonas sp.]|nr:hypothetical protein [Pseudolysinimonas sp.]
AATAQDRTATVYTVTEQGAREFHASVRSAIAQVPDSGDVLELRVAMDLSGELTRSEFLADASTRRAALAAGVPAFSDGVDEASRAGAVPPHVLAELQLEVGLLRAQLEWLDAVIAQVEAGGLMFAGEDTAAWLPPEGDPGWRMAAEREGYRARIAGRP